MGALGNGDGDGAYCLFGEENGALGEGGGSALADVVCAGDALDEGGGGEGTRLGGELVGGVEGQGQGAAAALLFRRTFPSAERCLSSAAATWPWTRPSRQNSWGPRR